MALDHNFGSGSLTREAVMLPSSAEAAREQIIGLQAEWHAALASLSEADLRSQQRTRWPYTERPLVDVIAWLNIELAKNASEIGYARFLYAVR
jgi:hypothetical protein